MKEKNREEIAEDLYAKQEQLLLKREEEQRLLHYNIKKAQNVKKEIEQLEKRIKELKVSLREADASYQTKTAKVLTEKERLLKLLTPLDHYLQEGAAALKKRRFLIFFARHPKVVLAQMLHQAAQEAKQLRHSLSTFEKGEYQELSGAIRKFCKELIEHYDKRWNNALYSGEFLTLVESWNQLIEPLRSDS